MERWETGIGTKGGWKVPKVHKIQKVMLLMRKLIPVLDIKNEIILSQKKI